MMEPIGYRWTCGSSSVNGFVGESFRQSMTCRAEQQRIEQLMCCRLTIGEADALG